MNEAVERATKNGWMPWLDPYGANPDNQFKYERVQIWRPEFPEGPMVVIIADLNPAMNVVGLFWKPLPASHRIDRRQE